MNSFSKKFAIATLFAATLVSAAPIPSLTNTTAPIPSLANNTAPTTDDIGFCWGGEGTNMQICNNFWVPMGIAWNVQVMGHDIYEYVPPGQCSQWRYNNGGASDDIEALIFNCADSTQCNYVLTIFANNPDARSDGALATQSSHWYDGLTTIANPGDTAQWQKPLWNALITLEAVDGCVPQFSTSLFGSALNANSPPTNSGFPGASQAQAFMEMCLSTPNYGTGNESYWCDFGNW